MIDENNKGKLEVLASTEVETPAEKEYPLDPAKLEKPTTYNPIGNRHRELWAEDSHTDYLG